MSSTVGNAPEWLQHVKSNVKDGDQMTTVYALATLSPEGLPKARMVIHRRISPSNLFITTTDTRMQKPVHLNNSPSVEMAWWIDPTAVQFRITGKAYVIPPASAESKEAIQKTLDSIGLDKGAEDGQADWWEKQRMSMWKEQMSGHLRASFARPKPGSPLKDAPPSDEWPTRLDAESVRDCDSCLALLTSPG